MSLRAEDNCKHENGQCQLSGTCLTDSVLPRGDNNQDNTWALKVAIGSA